MDRVTGAVSDTKYSLEFGNRTIEDGGFLDAFEAHASEILGGLRPEHLPEADKEVLREMGSPDAELAELLRMIECCMIKGQAICAPRRQLL